MRPDFLTLVSKTEPEDAAPYLADIVGDLLVVMSFAVQYSVENERQTSDGGSNFGVAMTSVLTITEALSGIVREGSDELARISGRSYWASGGGSEGPADVSDRRAGATVRGRSELVI